MKQLFLFVALIISVSCFSQENRKVSVFLSFQANKTVYDRTITNNSGGFGFGLQTVLNTNSFIRPTVEVNGDFFAGTKELYLTTDDKPVYSKTGMLSIHAGAFIPLSQRFFFTTTAGSHFYNSGVHFSARPGAGYYATRDGKWMLKVSMTNVFQRDEVSNENFGYVSFAVAVRF